VLFTSEVARGSYRSSDPKARTDDLAGGKESGGIEYGVDLLLALRTVKGMPDLVDVAVPKNRLGPKDGWRMLLDREASSLVEVESDPDEREEPDGAAALDACVLRIVTEQPSATQAAVRQAARPARDAKVDAALVRLVKQGRLRDDRRGKAHSYQLAEAAQTPEKEGAK
jgi:hypothetical protein